MIWLRVPHRLQNAELHQNDGIARSEPNSHQSDSVRYVPSTRGTAKEGIVEGKRYYTTFPFIIPSLLGGSVSCLLGGRDLAIESDSTNMKSDRWNI